MADAVEGSIEEMEAKALKAMAYNKASMAAAATAKERPATATLEEYVEPKMLKPAATSGDIAIKVETNDVFKKLRSDASGLSRGAATSRAYDSARRRALSAGYSHEDAKAFASEQYAEASKLWDKF